MLKNGKFIKEKPVKVGSNYIKPIIRERSYEEIFMQDVNLGASPYGPKRELGVIVWVLLIYAAIGVVAAIIGTAS